MAFALGCVSAVEASAQSMTISVYGIQFADESYIFHGVDYYDDTPPWVCSHGNYTTFAALTGPTGYSSWEPGGMSSSAGLPYAAGDFFGESGLSFDCSCVYPDRVDYAAYTPVAFQILPVPDSETSELTGWSEAPWRTRGEYRMTLHGGANENFGGQPIREVQLSGGDSCKPGTPQSNLPAGSLTGLINVVVNGNNQWEKDQMGWREDAVELYQAIRQLPCGFYASQGMEIGVNPGIWRRYQVNSVHWEVKPNSATTYRAPDAQGEIQWPQ
jgi:hypothetical protein